jgi:hypothetical protein
MPTRDEIDAIAWRTLHAKPKLALAEARGTRARNYLQLEELLQRGVDFEHAWSDFLHAFYDYKDASFFTYPSPPSLSIQWQAVLAGAAEWLSSEFSLPHPTWTDNPKYFLDKPWDPWEEFGLQIRNWDERLARCPEAFRKRNISFESRNLIAL